MRSRSPVLFLLLLLLHPPRILVSAAFPQQKFCYRTRECEVDPDAMLAAIRLIPNPQEPPSSSSSRFAPIPLPNLLPPEAYRVPAIFASGSFGQIDVRILTASGLQLDADTRMLQLWPRAKQVVLDLFDKCNMRASGSSAWAYTVAVQPEPPWVKLGFSVRMSCMLDTERIPGTAIYRASGVEGDVRIGRGSEIGSDENGTLEAQAARGY